MLIMRKTKAKSHWIRNSYGSTHYSDTKTGDVIYGYKEQDNLKLLLGQDILAESRVIKQHQKKFFILIHHALWYQRDTSSKFSFSEIHNVCFKTFFESLFPHGDNNKI